MRGTVLGRRGKRDDGGDVFTGTAAFLSDAVILESSSISSSPMIAVAMFSG